MSISYTFERTYPPTVGLIVCFGFFIFSHRIGVHLASNDLKIDSTYAPIGGMFAVITGFVGSFYGSIQSMVETRLARIAKTKFFIRFLHQIKEATVSGFLLAVASTPLMIISPNNLDIFTNRLVISIWMGASFYCLATFFRVGTKLFLVFESPIAKDQGAL